jgi:hypothetical protein
VAGPNIVPHLTKNGINTCGRVSAANTSSDGGGTIATDIFLVATGDATNGSFVEFVRVFMRSSAAATNSTLTVLRLFASTQTSGATTNANTSLIGEWVLPIQSADNTVTQTSFIDIGINWRLPAGQTLLATAHQGVAANSAIGCQAFGGDY